MKLETFKDVLDSIKELIGIDDSDFDSMLKTAVNSAYMRELSKADKRITTAYVPVINGRAELPNDLEAIEKITPELTDNEHRVGNAIISDRDTLFTVIYSQTREPLENDNDTIDLSEKFKYLLVLYGCYRYYVYRKKRDVADMYMSEYQASLNESRMDEDNIGEEVVRDAYSRNGGDE